MTSLIPASPFARGLGAFLILAGGAAAQAPLSLSDAMAEARRNGDESRLIAEKSARLDAQKRELWAGALPNVSAYANIGRGATPFNPSVGESFGQALGPLFANLPQNVQDSLADAGGGDLSFNTAVTTYSYGVQVTQSIYSFGRLGNAFRTADKQIRSQDAANQRALQELDLRTLDAFHAVVIAEARLKVIAASLERQQKTVGFLESNFKRGAGSRSNVLLTSASLKSLEPERIRAERDADAARMAFNQLLGRPIRQPLVLDTNSVPDFSAPASDGGEAGVNGVLDRRPDLEALRYQKETTQGVARAYRMQYLPALGFQGKWGILAYEPDEQLTDFDNNLDWLVGVGLTWPLFDGMANSSKARQYDSDARTLALTERRARNYARIEIESARREADAADTAFSAARQARDASAEALDLIAQDFRAGAGQVTDLLSAEEGLRAAESGFLAARYQKARAQAALRVALGMDLIKGDSK
jgi:outer membrane protein TolC